MAAAEATATPPPAAAEGSDAPPPAAATAQTTPCVLCIGMAGSGKTALMQRMNAHLHQRKSPCYVVNLDPAVYEIPYEPNIDVRDTVDYKEVMKQYGLGPNGGIVTSLNLFATKFDQVLGILEQRAPEHDYMLMDTPGQIEVFTWSASGAIITEALAGTFPTVIAYVVDTPRCVNPVSFMSNMLYACSILYKTRLPFVLVFNKVDVVSHEFAAEWMTDYEAFQDAVEQQTTYVSSLAKSMSLVLEEFYSTLTAVGVSAHTGAGIDDLFGAIDEAVGQYHNEYKPVLERLRKEKEEQELSEQAESLRKLQQDMATGGKVVLDPATAAASTDLPDDGTLEAEHDDVQEEDDREVREERAYAAFLGAQQ
eukprot:m.82786 g.82786  ORF g.82786 m.82786 type:complete len:366 (+) comp14743_c0_seq2:186-1283(+)